MRAALGREIRSPQELQAVMHTDYAPSEQQWAAISAPLEPSVVIAGAGSGKTTLMAARVVHLVVTGQVRPEQVLGLTFTNKAATELRVRIRDALARAGVLPVPGETLGESPAEDSGEDLVEVLEPTVSTYHAYAADLLAEHGLRIGHEPDTRVITDASRYQLGARVVARTTSDIEQLSDHPPTVIQNLLALDAAMTEHLVEPDEVRRHDERARAGFVAALAEEVAGKNRSTYRKPVEAAISAIDRRAELLHLVAAHRRMKRELGLMDFADQIALAARLAGEHPDVGALERDKFRVVLLDEFQDTSVAQALMLGRLFSGPDRVQGLGHPVTAVGDPNQAIYGWRGASVSNILNFSATFPAAEGEAAVLPLTVNRRSDRRILQAANTLAGPLHADLAGIPPLEPAPGAAEGEVDVRVFDTCDDELAWLADSVQREHTGRWSDIGVLTRDNSTAEACFDALTAAGVPVEIVGLAGLLRLPEVAEVVAVLSLLHDVTDNASLLTLLTGPRWNIGLRDLRLLGERAAELAGHGRAEQQEIGAQLLAIADGVDPAELPALCDALEDPGERPWSQEARDRFRLVAGELRMLRGTVGEPLLDVVRRIVDTTGVDVELASAVSPAAAARRDNLDLFLKAVAEFQAIDGEVTLAALLAYLTAEDEQGNGLDVATPSEADSVKLLTVHRAKGLEWHTVFLVGVCQDRFPSNRSRSLWVSSPAVLPAELRGDADDLPRLHGFDKAALADYRQACRDHDATEELRLGYVALTRAAHTLHVTSHCWGRRATPFGPSPYQESLRQDVESWGGAVDWLDRPDKGMANPLTSGDQGVAWPLPGISREAELRLAAAQLVGSVDPQCDDDELDVVESARVQAWDAELDRLVLEAREARADRVDVPRPSSFSATGVGRLREDPEGFLRDLVRPMPRPPSPQARFGTRFHAWVEARFDQQGLLDPDELPGRGDTGIGDESDLAQLVERFESGPFADRVPHRVEAPFALVLAGQVVRGRIDAVYVETDGSYLLVDWKTGRHENADPLQLAIYRLAWAELAGVSPERVRAAFHYVRSGRTVEPDDLPGRSELEAILTG